MPSQLSVCVLVDSAEADGLCGEWGLSLLARYGSTTVLLDFGQSDAFARNAEALGIDLAQVDHAVLSHAHYDHADGMEGFFARNDSARLWLSEACAESCWSTKSGTTDAHYIGIRSGMLTRYARRLSPVPVDRIATIVPGVHLVPHTAPGLTDKGARDGMLLCEQGSWRPDDFAHELTLAFELDAPEGRAIAVLSSCSHAGVGTILAEVGAAFPQTPIVGFVGGLHLMRAPRSEVVATAQAFCTADVRDVWAEHCTGGDALDLLGRKLPGRVHPLRTGMTLLVDAIRWRPRALGARGARIDVVVRKGADSWGAHDTGRIALTGADGTYELGISYDEREAPFVAGNTGEERLRELVSLTDEGDVLACAHARVDEGSPVAGVGIDLASAADFARDDHRLLRLMFSPREQELAQQLFRDDLPFAYAVLFGAKEAAFKATAPALRAWYRAHEEPLAYEVRDFGMTELGSERGELRHRAAQVALDRMGIARIEVRYARLRDMALVIALALQDERFSADT